MFNMKMTNNGNIAVILPNTDEGKRAVMALLSGTLSIPMPEASFKHVPTLTEKEASDVDKLKQAREAKAAKSTKKQTSTTQYDYEGLTAEQRMMEDQRHDIIASMIELARAQGRDVSFGDSIKGYYTTCYAKLRKETGYYPHRKTVLEYVDPYRASKINTVLKDGKGPDLLRVINREIRALTPPVSKGPRLTLNLNR